MREIKFRMWDKYDNKMIDWETMERDWNITYILRNNHIEREEKYPLMQYTGLQDKNGVEIYEGDIISFDSNTSIVFYNSSHCAFMLADGGARGRGYLRLGQLSSLDIEVIGNIYEHKYFLGGDYE